MPLLATLAVAKIVSGFELVLTQNTVVTASSPFLTWLTDNGPLAAPIMAYVLIGADSCHVAFRAGERGGLEAARGRRPSGGGARGGAFGPELYRREVIS